MYHVTPTALAARNNEAEGLGNLTPWINVSERACVKKPYPSKKKVYVREILSWGVLFHTVKTLFTDTCLIQTLHYGQFVLSLGKECTYILSKFNRLNTDTPFIRTLFMVPSLFALTGCGCTLYFTLYQDGDHTAVLSRFHCTS